MKIANGWRETNIKERHLIRDGKIVGKVARFWYWCGGKRLLSADWDCYCPSSPRTFIGTVRPEAKARRLVERKAEAK